MLMQVMSLLVDGSLVVWMLNGIFAQGVPWYLNYDDHDDAEAVGWGGNRLRHPGGLQGAARRRCAMMMMDDNARYYPFRRR